MSSDMVGYFGCRLACSIPPAPPPHNATPSPRTCLDSHHQGHLSSPSLEHALLVGGTDFRKAASLVKPPCDIVVGTPGRVLDFLEKGLINPRFVRLLVSKLAGWGWGGASVAGGKISFISAIWRSRGGKLQPSK